MDDKSVADCFPGSSCLTCLWQLSGCSVAKSGRTVASEVHVAAAANLRDCHSTSIARSLRSQDQHSRRPDRRRDGATGPADRKRRARRRLSVGRYPACGSTDRQRRSRSRELACQSTLAGSLVLWAPSRPTISNALARSYAQPEASKQVGCAQVQELAPYGAAAIQALKKEGLWTAVEPKLVYAQSISAAKQFADSGNVAAAFTALSLVINTS